MEQEMYNPSAYFLSRWLMSTHVYFIQPIIYSCAVFYFVGFQDTSLTNFRFWLRISLTQTVAAGSLGFLCSSLFEDPINGLIAADVYMIFVYFSGEVFMLQDDGNWFKSLLAIQSPFTYACELMMRSLTSETPMRDEVLDFYGHTRGAEHCMKALIGLVLIYFFLSWIAIVVRSRFY